LELGQEIGRSAVGIVGNDGRPEDRAEHEDADEERACQEGFRAGKEPQPLATCQARLVGRFRWHLRHRMLREDKPFFGRAHDSDEERRMRGFRSE
jgi:hypothetical protein